MPDLPDRLPEDRAQEKEFFLRRAQDDYRKDAEWLSKLAITAYGAHLFGKTVGRNIFLDLADLSGKGARYISDIGKKRNPQSFDPNVADGLYRLLRLPRDSGNSVIRLSKGGARLEETGLLQSLGEALSMVQDPFLQGNRKELEAKFIEHFQHLPRGARSPNFLIRDADPLTVKQILEHQNNWIENIMSTTWQTREASGSTKPLSIGILEEALKRKWITPDTHIDSNLFSSTNASGLVSVIDARMTKPGFFFNQMTNIFNLAGLTSGISELFGTDKTIGRVGKNEFFIGGNVFSRGSSGSLNLISTNQKLGKIGDIRYTPAVFRMEDYGLSNSRIKSVGATGPFKELQDKLGFGPGLHEKRGPSIFQTPFSYFSTARQVNSGKAKIIARNFKYEEDSLIRNFLGTDMPEILGTSTSGTNITKGKYSGKGVINPNELSFIEKLKTYTGFSTDLTVVSADSLKKKALSEEDILPGLRRNAFKILNPSYKQGDIPTSVSQLGEVSYNIRPKNYYASANIIDQLYDFGNYLSIRLNKLASSSMLGFGFRPTGNLVGNTAKLAAIPLSYYALFEGTRYADYLTKSITGISPIELGAGLYTKARTAQQYVRKYTGISSAASYIEDTFQGVDAGILGTAASLITTGYLASKKGLGTGLLGGSLLYATIGGPNVSQSPEDIQAEYSGEKKIPIRKSRWWMMGFQPFSGSEIDHFAPSWYAKLKQKPGIQNTYGSESNYWKHGSYLPTPSNWFLARNIIDPYWTERQNYYNRPYPITAGFGENIPIIGPIFSDTIGAIIKPRKKMHAEEQSLMVANSNISQKGAPTNAASLLGIPDLPRSLVDVNRPDLLRDRLEKYANVGLEPAGIWKFALEFFGVKFDDTYRLAEANNMTSINKWFYDLNLGGFGGQTEFIRRFILSDYGLPSKINQQVNPISNTMSRWLPGTNSQYIQDKDYFIDFTKGDAYTKLPGGEYRLPGPGYESVNKLYSGIQGVYSDVDKYLILSDVAPFSQAFKTFEGRVSKMNLPEYWAQKVLQAKENRELKIKRYSIEDPQIAIARANSQNSLTRVLSNSWDFTRNEVLGKIPIVGSKVFPSKDPLELYLRERVYGASFANWNDPISTIVEPSMYNIISSNPLTAGLQGGALFGLASTSFLNPIVPMYRNKLSSTIAGAILGAGGSTYRMVTTGEFEGGFVPNAEKKEREVLQYFDYLKYKKYRDLESRAIISNEPGLAAKYRVLSQKTNVFGLSRLETTGKSETYLRSLNRFDRPFFESFTNAEPGKRSDILDVVPTDMRQALEIIYGKKQTKLIDRPLQEYVDQKVDQYFENHHLPSKDWVGWHPDISQSAIEIRMIQNNINGMSDISRFGYYPAQEKETNVRFPFLDAPTTDIFTNNNFDIGYKIRQFTNRGMYSISNGVGPKINIFRGQLEDNRNESVFAFFQDTYR